MVDVVHESIDDEQAEILIWPPADFCGFVSHVGTPVATGLFIDCHFLFEVQLLCLCLHTELLSSEDSEWSRGR